MRSVACLQELRAARLLTDSSERQAVHALVVGQELEEPLLHSLNCIPCETARKPDFSVALDCRTMSSRAAQRKCGSHDGDPHHPSMAGFSVAELLEANPAIVSAEVLWVAPAIVVGWGIPAIAKAPASAVVTPAVVMTPGMAAPGHRWPGRTDAGAAQRYGQEADAELLCNHLHG